MFKANLSPYTTKSEKGTMPTTEVFVTYGNC